MDPSHKHSGPFAANPQQRQEMTTGAQHKKPTIVSQFWPIHLRTILAPKASDTKREKRLLKLCKKATKTKNPTNIDIH